MVVIAALALGVGELVAWNGFAVREITWAFPIGFDQSSYGLQSFRLYESIRARGLFPALRDHVLSPSPQGMLLQLEGALLCLTLRPGWLPILNVNFLHFLLLQLATAYAAWHAGGRRLRWAVLSVGLLLTLKTTHIFNGGLMDFRLDFAAFCLYGIFIAAVVRSEAFGSRRWSLVAWGVAAMLVWLRMITLTYLVGIGSALIVYFGLRFIRSRRAESATRLWHAGLGLVTLVALVLPLLVAQAPWLYAYYWMGHVASQEAAMRAAEFGIRNLRGHLTFYPTSVLRSHLGPTFLLTAGLVVVAGVSIALKNRRGRREAEEDPRPGTDTLVFCALCLVAPLIVLTLDVAKSPVVAGITAPAALWLAMLGSMRIGGARLVRGRVGGALVVLTFLIGFGYTSTQLIRHRPLWHQREEVQGLLDVYDRIESAAHRRGDSEPRSLSVFAISEYLQATVVNFVAFERHRHLLDLTGELGHSIFPTNLEASVARIDRSAFVVTADARPEGQLLLPFDVTIRPLIPALRDHVRERFVYMTQFSFAGRHHEVYRRPRVSLRGMSRGWMTADGTVVEIDEEDKRAAATLILKGSSEMSRVPGLKAWATTRGGTAGPRGQAVPVDLRVTGNDYVMVIPLSGLTEGPGPLSLGLHFSADVLPGAPGPDDATRALVILAPRERTLLLKR